MSSYIIAGSADSIDTAYCEQVARRIKAKYKNIDFRIVIKHPSEWQQYLQQICRIYGFLKKSNPIIYTFDGKIIGNRQNFLGHAVKYFGLDQEQLIVQNLTSKINMKLAEEQIRIKHIQRTSTKTYTQKIDYKYKQLLSKGIIKYKPQQSEEYLVNGIQYIHRQLSNSVAPMKFIQQKSVAIIKEQVVAEDINLMALSLQDQIKPQQTLIKQAFVTNNNQKDKIAGSQHDRLSQASKTNKTNKMHQSIISNDRDSKGVKQSNNTKQKIDQQNDDVPDYIDYPLKDTIVTQLADQFYVAFDPKNTQQQLIFYPNVDPNGNSIRLHNDGRPIKGHRVIIKEVHYQDPQLIAQAAPQQIQITSLQSGQNMEPVPSLIIQQKSQMLQPPEVQVEKSKTQPNIHVAESVPVIKAEDQVSQPHSDLNLQSHLNHHTLFIHKPLSSLELKNLLYFIRQTNTIATLQFLPQNPNPRVKLHVRKFVIKDHEQSVFPIERFIQKQQQDKQYTQISLPSQKCSGLLQQPGQNYNCLQINGIGFNHLLYKLKDEQDGQKIFKVIKFMIDHLLSIEEIVKRDIGYNLVITKKYILIVPLCQPYQNYDGNKLYLDGLAFLGVIHTAKLLKPYSITLPKVGTQNRGLQLKKMLATSTFYTLEDQ